MSQRSSRHSFKSRAIAVEIHKEADPVIEGFPNEFSQALLNILMNAKDALLERKVANESGSEKPCDTAKRDDRAVDWRTIGGFRRCVGDC